jgi:uncharacterized protein (DUF1330 family)
MRVNLCVLLWAREGREKELVAYEDRVLPLLRDHGGRVLQRTRSAGAAGDPLEVHVLEFPSEDALSAYTDDPRRMAMKDERERAIARTQVLRVELV